MKKKLVKTVASSLATVSLLNVNTGIVIANAEEVVAPIEGTSTAPSVPVVDVTTPAAVIVYTKITLTTGVGGAEAGDGCITGLESGKAYKVTEDGNVFYSTGSGDLTSSSSDASVLDGGVTEITGLNNNKTYVLSNYVITVSEPVATTEETPITVPETVVTESTTSSVETTTPPAVIVITEPTPEPEPQPEPMLMSMMMVGSPTGTLIVLDGGYGVAGDSSVTGLSSGQAYSVIDIATGDAYGVNADGSINDIGGVSQPLIGTTITGLFNGNTYKVIDYVAPPVTVYTLDSNNEITIGGLNYKLLPSNKLEIVSGDYNGNLVIAYSFSVIDKDGNSLTAPVSFIGANAFSNSTTLTGVIFPNGFDTIYAGAFSDCTNLSTVKFNSRLTGLFSGAFNNCTSITDLDLDVQDMLADFEGCNNLSTLKLHGCVGSVALKTKVDQLYYDVDYSTNWGGLFGSTDGLHHTNPMFNSIALPRWSNDEIYDLMKHVNPIVRFNDNFGANDYVDTTSIVTSYIDGGGGNSQKIMVNFPATTKVSRPSYTMDGWVSTAFGVVNGPGFATTPKDFDVYDSQYKQALELNADGSGYYTQGIINWNANWV